MTTETSEMTEKVEAGGASRLEKLRGTFSGTCAILGNGPSLPKDEAQLGLAVTKIGVNRSWRHRVTPLHVALDRVHIDEMVEGLWATGLLFTKPSAVTNLSWVVELDVAPEDFPLGRHIPLSGVAATQIALWLGFELILLCGFDLHEGDGRKFYSLEGGSSSFARQRRYFKRLMRCADEAGVKVRCIGERSALVEEGIVPLMEGR